MKKEQAETKLKPTLGLTRRSITGVLCLAVISLICARASAQNLFAVHVDVDPTGAPINGTIDDFTPNGVRSTFASGLAAGFNIPFSLAFDKAGNLFVAVGGGGSPAIYKFTPAGVRTTFASGVTGALAFDSAGNLFVADSGNILKFTPDGVRSTFASGLFEPQGLTFDRAGNLFVADVGAIYKFTPTGVRSIFASGLMSPFALAFDSGGNLFVADAGGPGYDWPPGVDAAVYKFTPSGLRSTVASENNQVPPFSVIPTGLAIDSADNLFVSDWGSENILQFTPSGVRTTFASPKLVGALAFQPTLTPTPTLLNISTRGSVQTGENVTIGGFIVTGTDSKQVVLRGLGPTLTGAGVTGALADPTLQLFDGSGHPMWFNDNWKDSQQAAIQATGLASPNDLESTILFNLQPGNYTTILAGKNGSTGVGLMEVYDISAGSGVFSGLTNVSTRGFVGSGQDVMIGGFISSGGNGSLQVIIRALGPTLTQFGVNNTLADPTLALVNSNGQVLASNDNWKNTQQSTIQATGFAPPNDLESAIFATLPNGNYTALLAGKNGATGVSLLEVYKVAVASNQ